MSWHDYEFFKKIKNHWFNLFQKCGPSIWFQNLWAKKLLLHSSRIWAKTFLKFPFKGSISAQDLSIQWQKILSLNSQPKDTLQEAKLECWMLGWTTWAPELCEAKESGKRTHLSTPFNAVFSWGVWVFIPMTYGIFFLLHSLQVTLSITALNVCYIMSKQCSD